LAAKLTLGFATLVGLMLPMVALAFVAGGNATNDINLTERSGRPRVHTDRNRGLRREVQMNAKMWCLTVTLSALTALAWAQGPKLDGTAVTVVKPGDIVPPRVVAPCKPGSCPFAGQTVTVISGQGVITFSITEVKEEFEAATGASLNLVRVPGSALFANLMSDLVNRTGKYDAAIAAAFWLGELVTGDYLISYDKYYNDPRFPKWDTEDVLPAPRSLLSYAGKNYMVANDHDGQVMYYRRDLLADPQHQAAFKQKYG
jgi:multiple sugar transport system substrate-binding protein